ncbi:exodeoxyribonuclease III [Planctomonas psychrotolerans]|uniref:exodeoxyribonuclease III n=1 Tax=Planctomonas psychrotolerans TaxID=2528712 RepID=UPI001238424D|nr:exodeoxyribonuclease III [Planctomonas psychrotolerans]
MRVATWNVNSIRSRVGRVVDWMVREDVDVLAMQEIKCKPEQFPLQQFEDAGYEVELHGLNQWNGVAIASRLPIENVSVGFPGVPGFGTVKATAAVPASAVVVDDAGLPVEARALGATINGVEVWSLYVPNGREVGDPHYSYKLEWLARLADVTRRRLADQPDLAIALMGDWNVAPRDEDVWDMALFVNSTHVSPPERDAFNAFFTLGLRDVVRDLDVPGYTYWDYKQLRFPRNEGMRIDFILGSPAFADLVTAASIHRNERKGEGPSDHVPVLVDLELDSALDDDRPMIF